MIVLVLIALAVRVNAEPADDAIATAIRYADILTGVDPEDAASADLLAGAPHGDDGASDGDDAGDGDPGAQASFASAAMLDVDPAEPGTIAVDDTRAVAGAAGAAESYEAWTRHRRPSRWGRLDVGIAWRYRVSEPLHAMAHRFDEVWLLATWRR